MNGRLSIVQNTAMLQDIRQKTNAALYSPEGGTKRVKADRETTTFLEHNL
jgi:hypothetical protein